MCGWKPAIPLMKPKKKTDYQVYAKWAGAGIQMIGLIGGMSYLGWRLDQYFENQTPGWTLTLALTGCALSMYYLIRSFLK